jgi:hypothetical protein
MNRAISLIIPAAAILAWATSVHHAAAYLAGSESRDPGAWVWALGWALALETVIGAATLRQIDYQRRGQHIPRELWIVLVGLVIVSGLLNACYVSEHSAHSGLLYLIDVVVGALTLPFGQALYVHIAAQRPQPAATQEVSTQHSAHTLQPAATLADVEQPVAAKVQRRAATKSVAAKSAAAKSAAKSSTERSKESRARAAAAAATEVSA